jgi:hypothetical protein
MRQETDVSAAGLQERKHDACQRLTRISSGLSQRERQEKRKSLNPHPDFVRPLLHTGVQMPRAQVMHKDVRMPRSACDVQGRTNAAGAEMRVSGDARRRLKRSA